MDESTQTECTGKTNICTHTLTQTGTQTDYTLKKRKKPEIFLYDRNPLSANFGRRTRSFTGFTFRRQSNVSEVLKVNLLL